ncbi:max-binding protein MNT-like isoform X2 [Scleropages formosus]|uniref:max-binding protein MNT-like isoform X2 n=1 Tax=Scleropages formosus TaxID=113540 RepID=UPI0010FAC7CB|nr:max-binding protein MNT-like isoform X2 [Scleropages formosus]
MSIDTLLEAARFLEWQAQQQQITREESESRENASADQEAEQRPPEVSSFVQPVPVNHVTWAEESRLEVRPAPVQPRPLPPPVPIAVIPIPVVSALPLSPSGPSGKDTHSPPQPQQPQRPLLAQVKTELVSVADAGSPQRKLQSQPQQLQPHPASTAASSQNVLVPGPTVLQGQAAPMARPGSVLEDTRQSDARRRPGGRAHLKECFETLKRNIPNVDEKKSSNLSVLRSALRYIQTLKRKEKEFEHEMERLAREKISTQQRLAELRNELSQWVDGVEMDRLLRQAVQPEDDQASTSTASEGEDSLDQLEDEEMPSAPASLPKALQNLTAPVPAATSLASSHVPLQQKPQQPAPTPSLLSSAPGPAQAVVAHPHLVTQPTVIAHAASASHASVIQAVSHVIQTGPKHIAHIAPSSSTAPSVPGSTPIGHITMHPVAHLGPALYPQQVAVSQSPAAATVVSHIAHTLSHAQVNGTGPAPGPQPTTLVSKRQVVAPHPQLVGQAVLNPVTMVTMPSFPVSSLKLA